jgi:beta-glucosidase
VKKARPRTIMCSYNRLLGEFASQNERLLTTILRREWGFDGLVVTDWGATVDRVQGLRAGTDLEMPHMDGVNDDRILQAVENGTLALETLDAAAERVTALILRSRQPEQYQYDVGEHRALARRVAAQSAVLLKNEAGTLPGKATARAAIIGAFARQPRYQGTGSSKITPIKLDSPYEEMRALGLEAEYAPGYRMDSDLVEHALVQEACRVAAGKEVVYLFAGLPDRYESETFDRDHMALPANHNALIEAVCQVNRHVVVILQGGSPMQLPWAERVQAILLMYLGGEAGGGACADLLLGVSNPSGKLAESWPCLLADNPSHDYFPGYPLTVEYRESLFVGYRYYDTAHKNVRYPFGYGLSYTQFEYRDLALSARQIDDRGSLTVACTVRNTGRLAGREIVQLYVACQGSVIIRPEQELKGFEKVALEPGEERQVRFELSGQDLAYYNVAGSSWHVESGDYQIRIGASSRDIRLADIVHVNSTVKMELPDLRAVTPCYYDLSGGMRVSDTEFEALLGRSIPPRERKKGALHTINSTFTDIQDRWLGRVLLGYFSKQIDKLAKDQPDLRILFEKMIMDAPLRILTMMGGDKFSITRVEGLVDLLNGHLIKGLKAFLKKNP